MTDLQSPVIPAGSMSGGEAFSAAADAALVLASGEVFWGRGAGAMGRAVGEICFNTSITGYQEILTDSSYAGQVIIFTFPHVGNVGANPEDLETTTPAARGCVFRADITDPASWRSAGHLDAWLKSQNMVAVTGIDTRRLTRLIRDTGAPSGIIVHVADGNALDVEVLAAEDAHDLADELEVDPGAAGAEDVVDGGPRDAGLVLAEPGVETAAGDATRDLAVRRLAGLEPQLLQLVREEVPLTAVGRLGRRVAHDLVLPPGLGRRLVTPPSGRPLYEGASELFGFVRDLTGGGGNRRSAPRTDGVVVVTPGGATATATVPRPPPSPVRGAPARTDRGAA